MVEFFRRTGEHELNSVKHARRDWIDKAGMTFGVDGDKRRFSVDLVPRVITPHEWHALRVGLVQRARAIELFLRDVYGDQRIVSDGVLSRELVEGFQDGEPRRACPAAPSGRRSWASTWSGTSSGAGGCWRTTSATPAERRTRSRSAT